jgi:hypothetical protein
MASIRQIEANRENAKNCTGPKTPEGKQRSSQNALKSGIDAKSEIIRLENPDDHAQLSAAFHARFAPATPEEASLVDALIRFEWLSRRYACVDTAIFENRFAKHDTRSLGEVFLAEANKICRAVATFNSVRRGFNATLKQLNALQAKRAAEPEKEEPDPAPEIIETEPLNHKLVSFLPLASETSHTPESTQYPPSEYPKPDENPPTAA